MSRGRMTMRAAIERNTASGTDPHGQPNKPVWESVSTVACHVWSNLRRQIDDNNKTVVHEEIHATFPKSADLLESDRIANVTDRRGDVLFFGPLSIEVIVRRTRHKEAVLQRLR